MTNRVVQQPHWYEGIRQCYENMRGKKTLPLKLMGLRKPHRQKAIIFYSDLLEKKSENMSFTAHYNGQAVSVFHVWPPSIHRRLNRPRIVFQYNPIDEAARLNHKRGAR